MTPAGRVAGRLISRGRPATSNTIRVVRRSGTPSSRRRKTWRWNWSSGAATLAGAGAGAWSESQTWPCSLRTGNGRSRPATRMASNATWGGKVKAGGRRSQRKRPARR